MAGLTLGDYLLWNSSVGGGGGVLAIISGLALLPLMLATAWLLALALARALARSARPRSRRPLRAAGLTRHAAAPRVTRVRADGLRVEGLHADAETHGANASAATSSSGKIAA